MPPKKHFVFGFDTPVSKESINSIREEKERVHRESHAVKVSKSKQKIDEEDSLRHVDGRVIVKIDLDYKDSWTFEDGTKIEYKRRFNNFNQRETSPVNAIVISGDGIKIGSEILVHPNSVHDSNRIFNYKDSNDSVNYYSIHNDMCFAWHDGNDWRPLPPYEFALRVFKPHDGLLTGIDPTQIKDTLYVTTGDLAGNVVKTIVASDYVIVAQNKNGREVNLIRFRPNGDEKTKREPEAICILHHETYQVLSGKYLVGISIKDAKSITEYVSNNRII